MRSRKVTKLTMPTMFTAHCHRLWVLGDRGHRHVAAVGAAHHADGRARARPERLRQRCQVGDRVEPPLNVVEVVIGAAVAGRAAHVGRRDGDALGAEVLDHGRHLRPELRLRPAVHPAQRGTARPRRSAGRGCGGRRSSRPPRAPAARIRERSRPPTAERVRRPTAGAAVHTSVESSGGPAVTVSEPSGANASAETTPPGKPSRRLSSSHTSLSPPRLIAHARCGASRVQRDDLDIAVVGCQELGAGTVPQHAPGGRTRCRRRRRRAPSRQAAGAPSRRRPRRRAG